MLLIWLEIGESKKEYCMRIAREETGRLYAGTSDYDKIISAYERVFDILINDTACIALIPTKSKKYELNIAYPSQKDISKRQYATPQEYYGGTSKMLFVSERMGGSGQLNDGVTVGGVIPGNEIGIIEVPDEFTIVQTLRKIRMMNKESIETDKKDGITDIMEAMKFNNQHRIGSFKMMIQRIKDNFRAKTNNKSKDAKSR